MFLAYKEDDKFQVVEFPVSLFMSAVDLNHNIQEITVADIDVFLDRVRATTSNDSGVRNALCAVVYGNAYKGSAFFEFVDGDDNVYGLGRDLNEALASYTLANENYAWLPS